jgi:PQQ-like domain
VIVALIELDLDAPPAPPPSLPPRYYRNVAAVACVLLVLALGGAAPAAAALWQRGGLVPLAGASTSYQLLGGLLYTLDANANRRTITAWSMQPVRRLWSVSTPVRLDPSGTVVQDGAALVPAGRYTMLLTSTGSTVIDPRTGLVRWTLRTPLLASSGDIGVVQHAEFAAGTEYDESSGDPGQLYWSETGSPHTQPPDHTVLRGIDLGSGRELWSVTERGSVFAVPAVGDVTGFVVIAADRLSLLNADTGRVIREHALPRFAGNDISFPEIMGDLLILRHDVSNTGAGIATAFGLDTLEQRWQVTEPMQDGSGGSCQGLPCEQQDNRLAVLDPATGVPRWYATGTDTVVSRGHDALELLGTANVPRSLRDPWTGRVKVDLSNWHNVAESASEDPIVVFSAQQPTGRAGFGVLTPGSSRVQTLGLSSARVERCASDERHVACRTENGVEVWSYRT